MLLKEQKGSLASCENRTSTLELVLRAILLTDMSAVEAVLVATNAPVDLR